MKIVITGPIRPSEDAVLDVIQTLRQQFPTATLFLSTWTNQTSSRIKMVVDHYFEVPEPTDEEITYIVTERTQQQRSVGLPDNAPGSKYSIYKMIYGMETICKYASPYIQDSDIVMRIRTDSMFLFSQGYFDTLLPQSNHSYIARKGDGFDWFCLTTFANLKRIWCFTSIDEYNKCVYDAWNPEDLIRRRVHIPILFLDTSRVECYILRENGYKHYYS
jgi:hypothetical protein